MTATSLLRVGVVAALVGSVAACSTRSSSGGGAADRNVVTGDELAATNARMVYQALERLRPNWLTSRGPSGMGNVTEQTQAVANVYMNGSQLGNIEYLKQVYVIDVAELRFWGAGEAGARFGMGNPRGVIEIIPRR